MKINSLNLIFVWGFILFFILPPKISAETLTTVSGKVYNNYKFIDFYADQVLVSHAEGFTFLKYTDLPKDIREQYSREIRRHNLQSPLKKFARLQLTTASQNANPLCAIRQLTQIKKQYSSYPGIVAAFDQAIRKKQNGISIGKILDKSADLKTPSQQYTQLQQMLSNVTDPGLSKEINLFLEKENNFLKQISEVLDAAISDAAELEVSSMFVQRFDDIKKVVTTYLANEQKESYLAKINKLVSAKQDEMQSEIESNKEQIALIVQKHQDAHTQLNKLFQQEENIDHQLGQKIIEDTIKLETAISYSQSANDYERALEILKTSFENSQYAVNKNKAKMALTNLEEVARKERLRKEQLAKLQKIKLHMSNDAPFVINKKLNQNIDWELLIIPASEKENTRLIYNLFNRAIYYRRERNKYNKLADECHDKGVNFYGAAAGYRSIATRDNSRLLEARRSAYKKLSSLRNKLVSYNISGTVCSLSHLEDNVILLAIESFMDHNVPVVGSDDVTNCWYLEYIPGKTNNQWNIE